MANEGKIFEDDVKKSFEPNRILRLYDTTNGYKGVANPCDFIIFGNYKTILLETKSVQGNRMPFSNITDKQLDGLFLYRNTNTLAGVLIQFREPRKVFFMDILTINDLIEGGTKSVTPALCAVRGIEVECEWKRTHMKFNGEHFIKLLEWTFRYKDIRL